MVRKLGNGGSTKFWIHRWMGERPLCEDYPRLFSISTQQQEVIRNMGQWSNNVWSWNLEWRRGLFQWEVDLVAKLESAISESSFLARDDAWVCDIGEDGEYSVKAG
jgi:hypothetical protein